MPDVSPDTRRDSSVGRTFLIRSMTAIIIALVVVSPISWLSAQNTIRTPAPSLDDPLVDVRIEGNVTIPPSAIAKYIKTRPGRPANSKQIRADVRALHGTRWFFSVEPRLRQTERGPVLTFRLLERPVVKNVEFRGVGANESGPFGKSRTNRRLAHLKGLTGLKPGSPFDIAANRESVHRIKQWYHEQGFIKTHVELLKGGRENDGQVIFDITEGPKVHVGSVKFNGNKFFSSGVLKTKLQTKRVMLGLLGGKYDPNTIPNDVDSLKQYYHSLGFFDVRISHDVTLKKGFMFKNKAAATISYKIVEGVRYKLRNIEFEGNRIFNERELRTDMKLVAGEEFNERHLNKDVERIKDKYGRLGRLFARVEAVPQFLEAPGQADLVFRIDEDKPYRIRRINVHFNGDHPRTQRQAILDRMVIAPGDFADRKLIERSTSRIKGSQIVERTPGLAPRANITRVKPAESNMLPAVFRGQSGAVQSDQDDSVYRGQNIEGGLSQPGSPLFDVNPQGNPLADALRTPPDNVGYTPMSELDIDYFVNEARTGRLMFGAGINSDAGLVGSIVLEELNFDILRPPTSFRDLAHGNAWRGGGQRFRAEAIPGNLVSRYLVSWTDPYFMHTDYSLGTSAFFFNRFYEDWDEQRGGGRVSVGRQFTPEISISGAIRLETIEINNPRVPTPPLLAADLGSHFLSTFRLAGAHDTRDSAFLPGEGHFVELGYEQAFGDFIYPRFDIEARQYYTVRERPDGGGRHIVTVGGQLGWTDVDTPIFERFFAGGFQTLRGFDFRGVGPRQLGVATGGRWLAVGSLEYQIPITADENIQAVAFTDFGTVENEVEFKDVRVTVGVGMRLTVPAMGPVPLAFDFAIPLSKATGDDTRLFSFYISAAR
jgi:outer membrane protein insertion porin family